MRSPIARWFRIRLVTILALLTIVVVVLGVFGKRWLQSYLETQALAKISEFNGKTVSDEEGHILRVYFSGLQFGDQQLSEVAPMLANLPQLNELDLVRTSVSDSGLQEVAEIPQLQSLYVFETAVSDKSIAELVAKLPGLKVFRTAPDPIGSHLAAMNVYPRAVVAMDVSPHTKEVVVGNGRGQLHVWRHGLDQLAKTREAHSVWTFSTSYSTDGAMIATGGGDDVIRIWDARSLEQVAELKGHDNDVHGVAFVPQQSLLVSSSDDRTIRVWNWKDETLLKILPGHRGAIPTLAVDPLGKWIASGSRDDTIRLWDIAAGELVHVLSGHEDDVMAVRFSSDGNLLYSASYDGSVRSWDVNSGKLRQRHSCGSSRLYSLAVSDQGVIAVGGADVVHILDVASFQETSAIREVGHVAALKFKGNRTLLASNADGQVFALDPIAARVTMRVDTAEFGQNYQQSFIDRK
ncbi:MAG: WD40 repeat domain-containing protein [Planctomycetaceae bacterium]|nr:WD40 repeat domain-containing protein [Planctomycetaceae bacterium]